jgi:hypothetical protein
MRIPRAPGLSLVAVVSLRLAAAPGARADFGAMAGLAAGATDNSQGLPAGQPGSEPDVFAGARAGLDYQHAGRLAFHRVAYGFSADAYARRAEGVDTRHEASWSGRVTPAATMTLGLQLGAGYGRLVDLTSTARPGPEVSSAARPSTAESFLSLHAREAFGWEMTPTWRLAQGLGVEAVRPMDEGTRWVPSLGFTNDLGLARLFRRDSVGFGVRAGHLRTFERRIDDMKTEPARSVSFGDAALRWDHTFDRAWSTQASAGLIVGLVPERDGPLVGQSGRAAVAYAGPHGASAGAYAERGAHPNVFLGEVFLTNSVGLRGAMPFGRWSTIHAHAGGAYQWGRAFSPQSRFLGDHRVWLAHAGVVWDRGGWWALSADYAFTDQSGAGRASDPADAGARPFVSFRRNIVSITFQGRYPDPRSRRDGPPGGGGGEAGGGAEPQ